jgi:glycosyltransferase involved in cell wall biosynthesis
MPNNRQKILIIGMADSVHVARWLSQFVNQTIDFTLFPSSPHRKIHPLLKKLITSKSQEMTVTLRPSSMRYLALPLSALDIPCRNSFRSRLLRKLIKDNFFDLIHVLELQHAGYLLLDTKLTATLPKVFITNWGSDIYWFEQFPQHKTRIIQLLQIASFYSAECQRDIEIVRRLGYTGVTMPVIPNSGGIDLNELPKNSLPPSQRKKIMIKGYTGFVGQALIALKACELAAGHLREYEIVIYSASIKARIRALKLRHIHKVQVTILKKQTPRHDMLQSFSEARIYIGISLSDGISTSLLEAMATGCYPIQTDTSCANEWLTSTSGSIVSPHAPELVANVLFNALNSNQLVDEAATLNQVAIRYRASLGSVDAIAKTFYNDFR